MFTQGQTPSGSAYRAYLRCAGRMTEGSSSRTRARWLCAADVAFRSKRTGNAQDIESGNTIGRYWRYSGKRGN